MPALIDDLKRRSAACELCASPDDLDAIAVPPTADDDPERAVLACATCRDALADPAAGAAHLRCLTGSIWSEVPAVQVLSWRGLRALGAGWASEALEGVWLEDGVRAWAEDGGDEGAVTKDSNGTVLSEGDSVTLIKDLVVKGANFTAKRGTMVKNIHLTGDPGFVEGRVNGTVIVLVTAFLKRQG